MKILFPFFLRLFIAFLAAKLFLGLWGADTPAWLLGCSLALVGLAYLLKRWGAELDWRLSRLFIRMNQLPTRSSRQNTPQETKKTPEPPEDRQ